MQEKEELWQTERSLLVRDLTDALKIIDQLKAKQMSLEEKKDEEIKKLKAQLQEKKDKEMEATHRIKQGSFLIEGNKFKIPLIYAFDMKDSNGIEMLIRANFLSEIAELEVSEEEFLEINESFYFNQEGSKAFLEQFKPVLDRLKHQGYIREEPMKHWKKNGELCKLDIINPDITIEDRPLKHVTLVMEDSFKKHVDSLLKIGAIRPSKSRHRTMAMIVNLGTTIIPATRREIKGKEMMVFNYKSLNDNTYKDQYSLLGINTIIKRVRGAKVFSKFDLKSGFHQVAMDEESIHWIAFLVPGGLYEWLVMPFSLKNAPALFQRKMDKCFKGTESFIAVYIDDILVFSKNTKEHAKHLERMLKICEDNGLVLSPTKMKIATSIIDFLGAVIGEGTIKLQPHIIKKIVNFNEEELKTKKGLRRNEAISSNSSLLSGGSSIVLQCLSEEYEDHLRRNITSLKLTKLQSEWINLMYEDQSPKTLKFQQQRKQSKLYAVYKQSYNAKPKYVSECQPKTITGLTKRKTLEFKTRKQEESSLNWKPLLNDWAATTSKPKEVQTNNPEDNMYRYNMAGFLEDDDSSDDSFLLWTRDEMIIACKS
nr:retrotransposon protein, putative, Ty3-gypsy subclass [Tanacetum cinerariifolium]